MTRRSHVARRCKLTAIASLHSTPKLTVSMKLVRLASIDIAWHSPRWRLPLSQLAQRLHQFSYDCCPRTIVVCLVLSSSRPHTHACLCPKVFVSPSSLEPPSGFGKRTQSLSRMLRAQPSFSMVLSRHADAQVPKCS